MSKINLFFIFYLSINLGFTQQNNSLLIDNSSKNNSYDWIVDYPENIRLPFTNLEIQNSNMSMVINYKSTFWINLLELTTLNIFLEIEL